jgi:hypothetical protein
MVPSAPFSAADPAERPDRLAERLHAGELLVFSGLQSVERLVRAARDHADAAFAPHDIVTAETELSADDFRARAPDARRAVMRDPRIGGLWAEVLAGLGFVAQEIFGDRLVLRIQPSSPTLRSRRSAPLPPHRDSWGSRISAQVNWWLPVLPLADGRTMLIWPGWFDRPVANTSGTWSLEAAKATADGPLLPATMVAPPLRDALPVLLEPGQLLGFSAAHLHASQDNRTGLPRVSLDTRTVWLPDLRAGRGAPNVDGAPGEAQWSWFVRLSDGRSLTACAAGG